MRRRTYKAPAFPYNDRVPQALLTPPQPVTREGATEPIDRCNKATRLALGLVRELGRRSSSLLNAAMSLLDVQARPSSELRELDDVANVPARVVLTHERTPSPSPLTGTPGSRLLGRDLRSVWLGDV